MIELLVNTASAVALAAGFVFISQAAAWRLCAGSGTLTRWLAVVGIMAWSATALFHLLISLDAFARVPAIGCLALLAGAAWFAGLRAGDPLPWRRRDRVFARRVTRALLGSRYRLIVVAVVLCTLPPVVRTLILPPLGWDTLTYHSVKSAMWVQHGSLAGMNGPGPWAYYRNMPGGSEALAAWAMLPMSSDAFAPLLEVVEWLAIGLATMTLARQLGVREPFASTSAGFVMAIPSVRLLLGSGYVELCLLATFVAGLALGLAADRQRPGLLIVGAGALGVSAATKLPMLAITALSLLLLVFRTVFRGSSAGLPAPRTGRRQVIAATLAYAIAVVPWLIASTIDTGRPLSPIQVQLGPVVLGRAPAEVAWYLERSVGPLIGPEVTVLRKLFAPPSEHTEALGLLAVVPIAGAMIGFVPLWRRQRFAAVLLGTVALSSWAIYFSPAFAPIRHDWTENSSRFLLAAVAVSAVIAVAWCDRRSIAARIFASLVAGCTLWNLAAYALLGFSTRSTTAVIVVTGALIVVAAACFLIARVRRRALRTALALCLALTAGIELQLVRDQLRQELLRSDYTLHWFAGWRYWADAVTLFDDPAVRHRIAVTSGPWQDLDNWFVYPFMGRRLQNEIVYVPISGDGRIRHFGHTGQNEELTRTANFWTWRLRLQQQRITHVISFRPNSIELAWMEGSPDAFERITGTTADWGIYRVR